MKAWTLNPRNILVAALCVSLAPGCTFKVGDGDGFDDTDDLDFTDKEPTPEAGGPDPVDTSDETDDSSGTISTDSSEGTSTSIDSTETDSTETDSTETDSTDSTQTDTADTSTTDGTDTTDNTSEPVACPGEAETGSCEECIQLSCSYEWDNCCGTGCGAEWTNIQTCMIETATSDALADLDRCSEETSPTGDALDLLDDTLALRSCVVSEFMGDPATDPLQRQEGEGTCTFACFYVSNL